MDNLPKNSDSQDIEAPKTDMSASDLELVRKFQDEGLPGLDKVVDSTVARMMDLYLSGKPYTDISRIMRVKKPLVLYLSSHFDWFSYRKEYLYELQTTIKGRMVESHLRNQEFLLQILHALQKKIGNKINQYLHTGDESHMNDIDLKEVDKYLKTVEMVNKMISDPNPKKPAAPAVGLNLGDGVTIEKTDDNKVTITPKQKAVGDMLKQFADYRREEEKKKAEFNNELKNKSKGESNDS